MDRLHECMYVRVRVGVRARACMLTERPLSCIVMHVDKAIRWHVLRMLHAHVGLCTWHRTDRWTPCRFHFPPSGGEGRAGGVERSTIFFWLFAPFFPGRPDFALRFFLRSFRYSRAVLLLSLTLLRVLSHSLSLSLSSRLFLSLPLATSIGMSSSLLPLLFTLVFSLLRNPRLPSSLALFFLAFAFVFCQPPFAALRVRFV